LIFNSEKYKGLWDSVSKELQELNLPDDTGGVNTGDQRAIAYLIWHFKPIKILEIGTHIGCSTVHLSVAQRELKLVNEVSGIVTVDIRDVNSAEKPWVAYKAPMSPLDLVTKVNYSDKVTFRCQPSVEYLAQCQDKYDLIFLDGGHSAELVYRELPLACRLLNENGIILLHDYFPNNKPIWDNNSIIPGPYLATERLINEGCNIEIKPLGALPWPTKQNSHFTSLALCTRGKY
jgi:predicted O-methyltransferase YrrM